jgi:hypothetical protein
MPILNGVNWMLYPRPILNSSNKKKNKMKNKNSAPNNIFSSKFCGQYEILLMLNFVKNLISVLKNKMLSAIRTIKTIADSFAKNASANETIEGSNQINFLVSKYLIAQIADVKPKIRLTISSRFFKLSTTSV